MSEASPTASFKNAASMTKRKRTFCHCLKFPMRALSRLRDMYVKSLGGCAGAGGGGRGGSFTAGMVALMPRGRSRNAFGPSTSFGPSNDDFRDLVRASSLSQGRVATAAVVPRSQSAVPGIGRIDEETSSDLEEDVKVGACPRSQSYAVMPRGQMVSVKAF